MTDISIIIVTYNSEEDIKGCLDSLLHERQIEKEIIVVDNASKDKTKVMLSGYGKRIRMFLNSENLGYADANNLGFSKSSGKYLFLLNPDTEVIPGSLKKMNDFMEMNSDVVILAPLMLNPDGSIQMSVRNFPDFRILFFELTGLSRLLSQSRIFNRWRMPDFDYSKLADVDQPMASAILLRRSFFVNQFMDKRFEIFFNDVDLCLRVRKQGGRIIFFPYSSIIHRRGKSTEKVKEKMIPLHTKGLLRYFIKHRRTFLDEVLFLLFLPSIMLNTILRILLLRFFSKDF